MQNKRRVNNVAKGLIDVEIFVANQLANCIFCSLAGDRFYTFLFHFSLYVLQKVIQRDHGESPESKYVLWHATQ